MKISELQPGPAGDAIVADLLMGGSLVPQTNDRPYTTDLDSAWTVMKAVTDRGGNERYVFLRNMGSLAAMMDSTPEAYALTICRIALYAIGAAEMG